MSWLRLFQKNGHLTSKAAGSSLQDSASNTIAWSLKFQGLDLFTSLVRIMDLDSIYRSAGSRSIFVHRNQWSKEEFQRTGTVFERLFAYLGNFCCYFVSLQCQICRYIEIVQREESQRRQRIVLLHRALYVVQTWMRSSIRNSIASRATSFLARMFRRL